jgi:altronate dehydratase small subunit
MERRPAHKINHEDNVATVMHDVASNETVTVKSRDGGETRVLSLEAIPFGHKIALQEIKSGEPVIKYGERIGFATDLIRPGNYVHVHNLESARGRGDLKGEDVD